MTPNSFLIDEWEFLGEKVASVFDSYANISKPNVYRVDDLTSPGVRPVISLNSDTLKYDASTSNGSKDYPFVVE